MANKFYKVILVGDAGVGKTNFAYKYSTGKFPQHQIPTIGVQMSSKAQQLSQGNPVVIQLWDTSGQQRYKSVTTQQYVVTRHYKKAQGALLMYDITDQESFKNLQTWIHDVKQFGEDNTKIMIVGNKCDCQDRKVSVNQLEDFCRSKDITLYGQMSVNQNINLQQCMVRLLEDIHQEHHYAFGNEIKQGNRGYNKQSSCCS